MYVIVTGIDSGEVGVLGPFETKNDAIDYGTQHLGPINLPESDWVIVPVTKPKSV